MSLFDPIQTKQPAPSKADSNKLPEHLCFKEAIQTVFNEIDNVELGQSDYVLQQIHFPKGQCPLKNLLLKFQKRSDISTMKEILNIAEQDFGKRFKTFIETQFYNVMGEEQ